LIILAVVAAPGCRTAGVDTMTRREPPLATPTVDVAKIIQENNRNASRISSLRANSLALTVTADHKKYGVDGRLAMERPRNFNLQLSSPYKGEVAEIGSNDQKFWFWTRFDPDHKSYYCNYDESGSTPLVATLQPDWIIEALGLRVIPPDEAKEISVTRGTEPGTIVLTHRPSKNGNEVVIRKTILLESSQQIREHRLYSQKMDLLARAVIERYQEVALADGEEGQQETVILPERINIEWVRERMAMQVSIPRSLEVNPEFKDSARDVLFAESPHKGFQRINLAAGMNPRLSGSNGGTTIRESLPPPARGVQLGSPESEVTDGQSSRRNEVDPEAVTASLPSNRMGDLVGPAIPQAPEIQFAKPTRPSGWIEAASPYIEQ